MRKLNKKYYLKNKGESGRQAIWDHKSKTILLFLHLLCACILLNLWVLRFDGTIFLILDLFPCCSLTSQTTVSGSQKEIERNVLP